MSGTSRTSPPGGLSQRGPSPALAPAYETWGGGKRAAALLTLRGRVVSKQLWLRLRLVLGLELVRGLVRGRWGLWRLAQRGRGGRVHVLLLQVQALQLGQLLLLQVLQVLLELLLLQGRLRAVRGRLREGVRLRRGVGLLGHLRLRLELQDLLRWEVQDRVRRRGRRGRLRGHLHVAEQHGAGAGVALLAVGHLLL